MRIPERGRPASELFQRMEGYRADDVRWRDGRAWAYVYDPGPEAEDVIQRAYMMYLQENGLDPTAFPSARRFETELVAMAASHLRGGPGVVGSFTSGGTESIMLAVKAARDLARDTRGVTDPEIVLPVTAHASFQKAAHYLGIRPVLTPMDPATFQADPAGVRAAVTERTIMIVGSAISYAHGVVDPIPELGRIALERDLWLHVDACMGGFLLPYFRRLGGEFPDFDLSVPGVSSISMDLHKYAFAAKGASTVLYRSKELRAYQIYTCADWTGYSVVNPTVQSTKSLGPLAAAWAVLNFIGDDGYLEMARTMREATHAIIEGLERIDGLTLMGRPDMNLLAFTADEPGLSVFHVCDEMKMRGWYVQPQLAYPGSKENVHLSINPGSAHWVPSLLRDLAESVVAARALPFGAVGDQVRETFGDLDPASLTRETFQAMLGMAGIEGTALPERMAEINEILNALPPALRGRLLTEYVNDLYT